jgi:hypothetical protein
MRIKQKHRILISELNISIDRPLSSLKRKATPSHCPPHRGAAHTTVTALYFVERCRVM